MKKQLIKLNDHHAWDLDKLIESRAVILANSGGGKSYAIRRVAEQAVEKRQVIIIDPEGEFSSLREQYDFVLAGKGADVPVETRSAALLATKLLELGKSAVIDLYELSKQDRQRYVKLFFNAMVDAPKELYHPVIVILDEAHDYAPEGKPSEATQAVEDLASKGRKRGYCLIPASQRISKLSKNVSAECNNKLIGRASQDLDMKRAGDELGFKKEDLVRLRQLQPGEFFAFGPAISDEIIKLKIGPVHTAHNKVSYKNVGKVPPASEVIKKVLGELKDLPQEAEKEAKTVTELKKDNADLRRMNTNLLKNPFQKDTTPQEIARLAKPLLDALRAEKDQELFDWQTKWQEQIQNWFKIIISIGESMKQAQQGNKLKKPNPVNKYLAQPYSTPIPIVKQGPEIKSVLDGGPDDKPLSKCARAILAYLQSRHPEDRSKTQMWVATGYAPGGGFNNCIYELTGKGLIVNTQKGYQSVEGGGEYFDTSLDKWFPKVNLCARKIFQLLLEDPNTALSKEDLATQTGYASGGGFNNCIYELTGAELIIKSNGGYIINPEILEL